MKLYKKKNADKSVIKVYESFLSLILDAISSGGELANSCL